MSITTLINIKNNQLKQKHNFLTNSLVHNCINYMLISMYNKPAYILILITLYTLK